MKKRSFGMVIFTTIFVMIVMFLFEFLVPVTSGTRIVIAGLSALVGGFLGNKLFRSKE